MTATKTALPLQLKFSMLFMFFGIISSVLTIIHPFIIFGLNEIVGTGAILYSCVTASILISCIIGIFLRLKWAQILSILYYSLNMIILIFNYICFSREKTLILELKKNYFVNDAAKFTMKSVTMAEVFALILGLFFGFFVIRSCFRHKHIFI